MLPFNSNQMVEDIMWCASRFRSMAHSELIEYSSPDTQEVMRNVIDDLFSYISSNNNMMDSLLIKSCGVYLSHPQPLLFYNIITLYHKTPALGYIMTFMAGNTPYYIHQPDIRWLYAMQP